MDPLAFAAAAAVVSGIALEGDALPAATAAAVAASVAVAAALKRLQCRVFPFEFYFLSALHADHPTSGSACMHIPPIGFRV